MPWGGDDCRWDWLLVVSAIITPFAHYGNYYLVLDVRVRVSDAAFHWPRVDWKFNMESRRLLPRGRYF